MAKGYVPWISRYFFNNLSTTLEQKCTSTTAPNQTILCTIERRHECDPNEYEKSEKRGKMSEICADEILIRRDHGADCMKLAGIWLSCREGMERMVGGP